MAVGRLRRLAGRAALPLLLLMLVLPAGCEREPSATSSAAHAADGTTSLLELHRDALLAEAVEEACVRAAAAIDGHDRAAWHSAFTVADEAVGVRGDLDEVFDHLAPLRVSGTTVHAEPIPSKTGSFDITIAGRLGAGGPPDRLLAERILAFDMVAADAGPELRVTTDDTPDAVRSQYLMAFHKPRLLRGPDVVVVYERAWRARARRLADPAARARDRVLEMLGVGEVAAGADDGGRQLTLFVYGSHKDVRRAFATVPDQIDERIRFFSHPPMLAGDERASPTDIGVVAPALGDDAATELMLQHEIGHAYTMEWFFETDHSPDFFLEGLAVAVEGTHSWWSLKSNVAAGGPDPGLADAIALGDIWSGRETGDVRLLYDSAGSFVLYLLDGWGVDRMRAWMKGVADSDLSTDALTAETKRHLGVAWSELQAGWRAYVERLP